VDFAARDNVSASFLPDVNFVVTTAAGAWVVISDFEANELIASFRRSNVRRDGTLRMFAPRSRRNQRTCLLDECAVPSSPLGEAPAVLMMLAGQLYFEAGKAPQGYASAVKQTVRALIEAHWGNATGARHTGSDVAGWLVSDE